MTRGFEISRYLDEYRGELEKLVDVKAKGKVRIVTQVTKKPQQTQYLISALKDSFQGAVVKKKYRRGSDSVYDN